MNYNLEWLKSGKKELILKYRFGDIKKKGEIIKKKNMFW